MSVQQTIIAGIKEQLFCNDYLVLPNFGGFVLKSRPSHFSASGGLLVPPSKTLSFNVQLKQNDGILVAWLQTTLKCDASTALSHLRDFTAFCTGVLNAKRRLSLEGIGFFYLDFENNICFEPQQDANFLASSFGFAPLSVKELEPELVAEIKPKKEAVFVDRLPEAEPLSQPVKTRRNYRQFINLALLALVFISLLGLIVNNLSIRGELRSSLVGMNYKGNYIPTTYPELKISSTEYKQRPYVTDANGIATLELEGEKSIAVNVLEETTHPGSNTIKHPVKHIASSKGFEIVLGCFAIRENAQRMVRKLANKGIDAALTGQNNKGMYVVGSTGFDTKEEAIARLVEIKDKAPSAWIKKQD